MRKKSFILLPLAVMLVLFLTATAFADATSHYLNPLMKGADPTIARAADGYYYSAASDGNITLKRHETILGVATAKSRVVWERPKDFGFVWGPYIYRLDGKWYIYFASGPEKSFGFGHPSSYVLENDSPDPFEGTWTLKGGSSNADEDGQVTYKQGLLNTEGYGLACGIVIINGQRYFTYTKYYYYYDPATGKTRFDECPTIVKMKSPWELEGKEVTLARPVYDWEKHGDNINEGAAVVERNGKVYFAYSVSSFMNDNYAVGVSVADLSSDIMDEASWTKYPQPAMKRSDENSSYGPGSPLFLKSEDGTEDWILYHGIPTHGQGGGNRGIRAQRINWDDTDFISLGIPSNPGTVLGRPSGEEKSEVYEAEDAQLSGADKVTGSSLYASDARYVKYSSGKDSDYVEFTMNTESEGTYSLDFRYNNNTAGPVSMQLAVNQESRGAVSFPTNGGWESNFDNKTVHGIRLNAGANKVRLSGKSALALDALILKKSALYEAENAELSGNAKTDTDHPGYSGTGFVGGLWIGESAVSFKVNAAHAGSYSVKLAYSLGFADDRTLSMYVNGTKIKQVDFFSLKSWDKWADRYDNVFLKEGENVITYRYDQGDTGNVNLDYIAVTEAATWTYEAETAKTTGAKDAKVVKAKEGNTGIGYVNGLAKAGSSVEFAVEVEHAADYDVKLRYAKEGADKTLALYVNGAYAGDVVLSPTGGAAVWKEQVVTVPLGKGKNIITYKSETESGDVVNLDNIHLNKRTPWKYQAENALRSDNLKVARDHLWYDGNGFVGGFEEEGDSLRFEVNVPYTADYTSTLRYSGSSAANIRMTLYVNENRIKQVLLPPTANWDTWSDTTETVRLKAGKNIIEFIREGEDTGRFNIDSLTIDKFAGGFMSSSAKKITPETMVKIQPKHSGKSLDVDRVSSDPGAVINQWANGDGNNQLWRFLDLGTGYYQITSVQSGHAIDLKAGSAIGQIYQNVKGTGSSIPDTQQWKLERDGEYYKIINKSNGKVLTVDGASMNNGAVVRVADDESKDHQRMKIEIRNLTESEFRPVADLTAVPATMEAGQEKTLFGTVSPDAATRKSIMWSIKNAGNTGAVLNGNVLSATKAGAVTVTARIKAGRAGGGDYTKDFTITVTKKDADLTPDKANYDLYVPGDVSTNVIWNEAKSVTGVVYATTVTGAVYNGALGADGFAVTENVLTIKNDGLDKLGLESGGKVDFSILFDKGNPAAFTVHVVDSSSSASHSITVTTEGRGTASASAASAVKDAVVSLAATPEPGYLFKGWKVIRPEGLRITDDSFIMPGEAVEVTAVFAAPAYRVTYDKNGAVTGAVPVDGNTYAQGVTVAVYGNTGNLAKTGYVFKGWNTEADGSGSSYAEGGHFTMGTADVTLYAQWAASYSGGSSGGSSTSSGGETASLIDSSQFTLPAGKKGEFGIGDDIKIIIPAGAVQKDLRLTVGRVADIKPLLGGKDTPASPVFELQKNFSEPFDQEITLVLTFDPAKLKQGQKPVVFTYDEGNRSWVKAGGEVNGNNGIDGINGNTIAVKVKNTGKFAVFGVDQPAQSPVPKPPASFRDLAGHWAEAAIRQAVQAGIVSGYPDGTFKPDRTVTRSEFAVMLMGALKPQTGKAALTFTDKEQIGAWALDAVAQAVEAGMIAGYEDGSFRPDAEITRAEMAMMLATALGKGHETAASAGFADDGDIPDWAKGSVAALYKLGMMEGKDGNRFAPGEKATRAEAVKVLLNLLQN